VSAVLARDRVRARIEVINASAVGYRDLRRQVLEALHTVIGFDAYVWLLTDPVTAVGTAPLADVPCLPELPTLIKAKYGTPVNRWTVLQRETSPVGLLHAALDGELSRSRVWRAVMSRCGVRDVASLVFADHFGCWGFLDLWRCGTSPPFTGDDGDFLGEMAGSLTAGLRRSRARTFVMAATVQRHHLEPVVFTLDDDLRIISRTAASQSWLDMLLPPVPDGRAVPASVYNVAAQQLAVEAGVDDHPPTARVHLADGFWLTLRAARLADEPPAVASKNGCDRVVVTIEESSAAERLDLFARAHGLSAREDELFRPLAVGSDTRAMSHLMSVTENTIQDHLKSIFTKTGARDRLTVLSRALGTRAGVDSSSDVP
jgi:DNA-binding CsgD family transcriptional regulator